MGKYVKGRRGTAAHRRHHQEKRAERTFASTSRGWRQPRERERKKKIKTDCLVTLVCVSICTQSLPRLFGCGCCCCWRLWRLGGFCSRKWIEKCVTLRRVKTWSPCWLLCGDMMRLLNHHLSVCPLRWGIIFEILLRSSSVEWSTVTAAVVTFKDESALYVRAFPNGQ